MVYLHAQHGTTIKYIASLVTCFATVRASTITCFNCDIVVPDTCWVVNLLGGPLGVSCVGAAPSPLFTLFFSCYHISSTKFPTLISTIVGDHSDNTLVTPWLGVGWDFILMWHYLRISANLLWIYATMQSRRVSTFWMSCSLLGLSITYTYHYQLILIVSVSSSVDPVSLYLTAVYYPLISIFPWLEQNYLTTFSNTFCCLFIWNIMSTYSPWKNTRA